jgi:ketol-acid reductoisomerase
MMRVCHEEDADLSHVAEKTVAIIGSGDERCCRG